MPAKPAPAGGAGVSMLSRKVQWLPLLLMLVGISLLATALWFAWHPTPKPVIKVEPRMAMETAAFYRPNQSDWWVFFGKHPEIAEPALHTLSALDSQTPALPANTPMPLAIAAAGSLRIWQFSADVVVATPAQEAHRNGRWHLEKLTDATLLFWLADDIKTTAVDRVAQPLSGSGQLSRRWLQQRLDWPAPSCEPLPALLQSLPDTAHVQLTQEAGGLRWQLVWLHLPPERFALLQQTGAPFASAEQNDDWHWREADLAGLPIPADCPATTVGTGFVARVWQQDGKNLAALARAGASKLQGFPLPLPDGVSLKPLALVNAAGMSSGQDAAKWLSEQSLQPEPGLLLAIQHRQDASFAGMQLQLRTLAPDGLQLQWRWPVN